MNSSESDTFFIGLVILSIAIGSMTSELIGWSILGGGFVLISILTWLIRVQTSKKKTPKKPREDSYPVDSSEE